MALKRISDKEESPLVEIYSTKTPFFGECKSVPDGFPDVVRAVEDNLAGYCVLFEPGYARHNSWRGGGPVDPRTWKAVIETEDDQTINLAVEQHYGQPGVFLTGAKAWLKYNEDVSQVDLETVRIALTNSGLEKIE